MQERISVVADGEKMSSFNRSDWNSVNERSHQSLDNVWNVRVVERDGDDVSRVVKMVQVVLRYRTQQQKGCVSVVKENDSQRGSSFNVVDKRFSLGVEDCCVDTKNEAHK